MGNYTNKKINEINASVDINESKISLYITDKKYIVCIAVIILITGIVTYIVSISAISVLAMIEIGISYLAVLCSAIIDIKVKIIPNFIPAVLMIVRVLFFIYEFIFTDTALKFLISSILGCFICFLILMIADKISKGGIGMGDIKLISAIGFMCGVYLVFSTLILSLFVCVVVAILLLILKKKTSKDRLPFGPFIYIGFLIMLLLSLY